MLPIDVISEGGSHGSTFSVLHEQQHYVKAGLLGCPWIVPTSLEGWAGQLQFVPLGPCQA